MLLPSTDLFLRLVAENDLEKRRFSQWIFNPGMLFRTVEKWWDATTARGIPHEGLDVAAFLTKGGQVEWLTPQTRIPAAYGGTIARLQKDFLGFTCFLRHDQFRRGNRALYSIYGHIEPLPGLREKEALKAGDILGTLADTSRNKTPIRTHLHFSLAWISSTLPDHALNWESMGDPEAVILIDPLSLLTGAFSVMY
ncbi:MAG: peptidoglycan DD-metalloendopeptidase family protein [Thermodesulfobacteriota bacterium]